MDGFKVLGDIQVDNEDKVEMNNDVLKLLHFSGMRYAKTINLFDENVIVLNDLYVDEDHKVHFNYNIFENIKYNDFFYDVNNQSIGGYDFDIGVGEFSFVFHLIETLQEIFSKGSCYLTLNNKPFDCLDYFVDVIQALLNKNYNMVSRKRLWNMYKTFMLNDEVENLTLNDVLMSSIVQGIRVDINQLAAIYASYNTLEKNTEENELIEIGEPKKICDIITKIFGIIKKLHFKEDEQLFDFLKKLLDSDLADRKRKACEKGDYGLLAELSLYVYPAIIVSAYAHIKNMSFWDLWRNMNISGYEDIIDLYSLDDLSIESCEFNSEVSFYRAIGKETEDDFIDVWDGYNLNLSYTCSSIIDSIKSIYLFSGYDESIDTEDLKKIVQIHTESTDIRYVNESFVKEFIENIQDDRYRKAISTYIYILHESISYMEDYRVLYINTFQSLMNNHPIRKKIFGF